MGKAFDRILLAYDDSPASRVALEYACALARDGATLIVAHAVNESGIVAASMTSSGFAAVDPATLIDAVDAEGESVLQSAIDACATRGVSASRAFIRDSARTGIADIQHAEEADLIVLGTHGRHGIARTLLGSVAEDILRASSVPVLVLTGHAKAPPATGTFARALVAIDDSAPSVQAMAAAARLAARTATDLVLCNVIDTRALLDKASTYGYDERPIEADLHAAARKVLDAAAATTDADRIDERIVAEGEPAQTIEHIASQRNCDVVVMGSHLRGGLERLFFGSVAEAVMRSSAVPVLVVPDAAAQATAA